MSDKPRHEMTDDELRADLVIWTQHVEKATGWASAYFAAKQLEAVVSFGNRRGLAFENPYPIKVG